MLENNKKPTDEEVLEIIRNLYAGDFKTEEEGNIALRYIEAAYPCAEFTNLIFWDKRNLTPEQILEEGKKKKPILL